VDVLVSLLINGFSLFSIYLLIALGLNITFGMMGVINFAHGEFLMLGAYTTYFLQQILQSTLGDFTYFLSIPLAFVVCATLGLGLEALLIRRLYGNPFASILTTWGVSLILQQLVRDIFGPSNVDVVTPHIFSGGFALSPSLTLPWARLFLFAIAMVTLAILGYVLYRTRAGRQVQAVLQNRSMAGCLGIPTKRMDAMTFAFGTGIAGVAGTAVELLGSIGPSTGQHYIVDSFLVVVLGGVGSLGGTVAGALLMGFASPALEYFTNSSMGKVLLFIGIIIFLLKKPNGLITRQSRVLD
jgi:urea transport system permease protein